MTRWVGGTYVSQVIVENDSGTQVNASSVTLTVTRPDLTTFQPGAANPSTGVYEYALALNQAGRWVLSWVTTGPDTAYAEELWVSAPGVLPVLADVKEYLGTAAAKWSDVQIQRALDAQIHSQRHYNEIPADYPEDLWDALMRRIQRHLALRALPLGVQQNDSGAGPLMLPGKDPWVQSLEEPYSTIGVA